MLKPEDVADHVAAHKPAVLRHSIRHNARGLEATNFGASKGSTHDHVVIFPTDAIKKYLKNGDPSLLADETRSKFYVAVTRAKHSVAFVV